jgi:Flp pilus assembly protein TadD
MNPNDDSWDEERISDMFASAAKGGQPPDKDFLARLREQSLSEFAAKSGEQSLESQPSDTAGPTAQTPVVQEKTVQEKTPASRDQLNLSTNQPSSRRVRMSSRAWRFAAAISAAALVIAVGLWSAFLHKNASWALGNALDNLANARSVHFNLTSAGQSGEAWATRSKQMRWNHADGTYRIAKGKDIWLIDEGANQAVIQPCAFFRSEKTGLDSLALVGLTDEKSREQILNSQPAEEIVQDSAKCYCYRVDVLSLDIKRIIHVEAVVDAATQMLRSLETRVDRDGRIEPVAKLTVLGLNEPVKEELFVVGDTLTEDGRIGKLIDAQGIVSVKPVMARRWTPARSGLLLKPGDWVQADLRGANAAAVRLVKQTTVTLGPGAMVELAKPTQIHLYSGDLKIAAGEKETIELTGPDRRTIEVKGTAVYRVDRDKLVRLEKDPLWLKGFEGSAVGESIGSLVAKVEGRNVPLTVGYHKVTVEICDQIARTAIEESFVNHTDQRLEGQFFFPLPQDASISGFGMWIGNNLVEADIVEKQRAREIYETILRENRDPGLLEWTGGNIFKARVFPIEPHSQKRIKISYTQVLPLRDNSFRYSYALQSELLKQHPLKELAIDVKINSAIPLANVASPTHLTRIAKTEHSAHVEFAAQEYTPKNDFEVVVDVDGRQSEVVLSPHRRGDDGYFMLLVTPPGGLSQFSSAVRSTAENGTVPLTNVAENGTVPLPIDEDGTAAFAASRKTHTVLSAAAAKREILPDAEPLELLVLADTSASLDAGSRAAQAELIGALLGSLTPADTINLACTDVECDWAFEKPLPAEAKNVEAARKFLADRVSLGWTDLDKAFASAISRCGPKTRVVYIGDGTPTTGDADPTAFAIRLRRMYEKKGTFYAVSVGSSYESVVLKAIASLGGGSMRQISGEQGPQAVALELLDEFARPGIRDLKVDFKGLRTARVYPTDLPNVPVGSQQIILGRYLPEGRDQLGEIIVTGMQGDKPVKLTKQVSLKDAEQGNSFIPRLWARMHLDALLQQGNSQTIQDEIIALSEEYHIITPYTSLLVLESDADRARFKVTPRFQMRDGEKFFAERIGNANYELTQQQMKLAGNWRIGLRDSVLRQFGALGRDPAAFNPPSNNLNRGIRGGTSYLSTVEIEDLDDLDVLTLRDGVLENVFYGNTHNVLGLAKQSAGLAPVTLTENNVRFTHGGDANFLSYDPQMLPHFKPSSASTELLFSDYSFDGRFTDSFENYSTLASFLPRQDGAVNTLDSVEYYPIPFEPLVAAMPSIITYGDAHFDFDGKLSKSRSTIMSGDEKQLPLNGKVSFYEANFDWSALGNSVEMEMDMRMPMQQIPAMPRQPGYPKQARYAANNNFIQALNRLFPALPVAREKTPEPKRRWPAEARALAESLLRTEQLAKLAGGLEIRRQLENYDPRWNELTSRQETVSLVSPNAWLIRDVNDYYQTIVNWCDGKQRGVLSIAFQLGRVRESRPADLAKPPLAIGNFTLDSIESEYWAYKVELRPQAEDRTLLVLTAPFDPLLEVRVLMDTKRHVILSIEHCNDGKVNLAVKFGEFIEIAGAWWATRIETLNDKEERVSLTTLKYATLDTAAFQQRVKEENKLADKENAVLLRQPALMVSDARRALADGKATFDDRMTLLAYFALSQQWTQATQNLEAAEKLASGKPGMRWVRDAVLKESRRGEELKMRLMEEAAKIAKPPAANAGQEGPQSLNDSMFLADYLYNTQAAGILENNEMLALLDALEPVYSRQSEHLRATKRWQDLHINMLRNVGRAEEALKLQEKLAAAYPRDYSLQEQYAQNVWNSGEHQAAMDWLKRVIDTGKWLPYEAESLRNTLCQDMRSDGLYLELVEYLAKWCGKDPDDAAPYQEYLNALIRVDRVDEADKLAARWLKEAQISGKLPPAASARLSAALVWIFRQNDRIEEQWLDPLAEAALFFARSEFHIARADNIMSDYRFQQSDQIRKIRKTVAEILTTQVEKLPAEQIRMYVKWLLNNNSNIEPAVWKKLSADLRIRWSAETKPRIKDDLSGTIVSIISSHLYPFDPKELLDFYRLQCKQGPAENAVRYHQQLFDCLTSQPWNAEYEDEAIALLGKLVDPENQTAAQQLVTQIRTLHVLTDRMVQGRYQAKQKAIEHPEELPRPELAAKQTENLKQAREEYADRLAKLAGTSPHSKGEGTINERILPWITAERLYLDILVGRNLKRAVEDCWEQIGPQPKKPAEEDREQAAIDQILENRYLIMLCNLAARKDAEPASIDRLLKYLDAGIALDARDLRWKLLKYELLVALDRPKDLEQVLRDWDSAEGPESRWRISLGFLLAEQGKLDESIKFFEAAAANDELGPNEYRSLADWYMAVNRRTNHEQAARKSFTTQPENVLSNMLNSKIAPWQRNDGKTPTELDPEVLTILSVLYEKSGSPQNYMWRTRDIYIATRDFRVLSGMADAVVGHTAVQIYPFLQSMSSLLSEVKDEATVDSLVEHLAEVREKAKTTVDQRALDLLELMCERRAAELLNQGGPHGDKALAAMQRAFHREWTPGERRLMADFLHGLGSIGQKNLADEQIGQLQTLHREAAQGSEDRLHIALRLAQCLWSYSRYNEPLDLLFAALDERQQSAGGILPTSANNAITTLISYCEQRTLHARAESVLLEQLKHPVNRQQRQWLSLELYSLYTSALIANARVSLGSGAELFKALERKLIEDMDEPDQNHRNALISKLCEIYGAAPRRIIPGVADDLKEFADKRLPEILKRQQVNYSSMVQTVANALGHVAGPREALVFLIKQIEEEPAWLRTAGEGGWGAYCLSLGKWRFDAGANLGDLEPRLLKIVLAELRHDLQSRQSRNRVIYNQHNSFYWGAQQAAFLKEAKAVWDENRKSGAAAAYIASYIYSDLGNRDDAIAILLAANGDKLLDEGGQVQLVNYLHEQHRHGESIALLQGLTERRPENIQYRVLLMNAYFHTNRFAELKGTLDQTDQYFHEKGKNRWTEDVMAAVAQGCLDNHLYEQSVKYYNELIDRYQKSRGGRAIGDGALSQYYRNLGEAYSGLKKTAEAVDAVCGAIVCWGPRDDGRKSALAQLQHVLFESPDTDAYAADLDKQASESGQDKPLVRKALGQAYVTKGQYDKAIVQLNLACQLQPNDAETLKALLVCYDQQGDKQGAIRQVLQSLQLSRRDMSIYKDLGERLTAVDRPKEAERAYTSIVEMLPAESESYQLLAEIRQRQDRWDEAIAQWDRVARLRALEPGGLLGLAAAQIHQKQWDKAADSLAQLRTRSWPRRFNDVQEKTRQLERQLEGERKKS